jgi:mono/diheme cytochrome c family protein
VTPRALRGAAAVLLGVCGLGVLHAGTTRAGAEGTAILPERLADTGLYDSTRPGEIDPRNRAFVPQYPLWSDGLTKRRWVYLPPGFVIDATDEYDWRFPEGTRFWKEFSLGGRKVETRMSWKTVNGWVFASYAWNDDGNEATLAPEAGVPDAALIAPGKHHEIPSRTDCAACHGTTRAHPLGFTALQLSPDRDPRALHAEPVPAGALTLRSLVEERRIAPVHPAYRQGPRIRTADADTRAALGYLTVNCGPCHDGGGGIAAPSPALRLRDLLADGDAVARALIGQPTRWQIPGLPEGATTLVHAGTPEQSALLRRMMSRAPSSQMPPLGTVLRDEAAIDFLSRWIARLPPHRLER